MTFPPHWFTLYRQGTILGATLQPCTCVVPATSWRLFPDSLRVSDLIPILEALANEPSHCSLVLCYVDSIDSAHYLMEAARVALAAFDDATRERLFGPAPVPPGEAERPREPLPPGHPDSFPMDELRRHLGAELPNERPPVPYGSHYEPKGKSEAIQICGNAIQCVGVCRLPDGHAGDHVYTEPQ